LQAKRTENLDSFGVRLRGLAEERGLSQAEIARRLGIAHPARVGNWFQGKNKPREHAVALARLLGISTDFLLEGILPDQSQAVGPEAFYPKVKPSNLPKFRYPARLAGADVGSTIAGDPIRIQPGFEPKATEPTIQLCHDYLAEYLRRGQSLPGWVSHTYLELRDKFPLEKPARLKKEDL
jgi:DNA-binding XRE family transcriptional regulator